MSKDKQSLEKQVEELTRRIGLLEDEKAIRKLHYSYGYYLDKCLYDQVVELFAEDGQVRFMRGVFKGKAGVRRLYIDRFRKNFTNDHNGPVFGFLLDHPQMQDIVDVAPDGKTARGRFRCTMQAGVHHSAAGADAGFIPRQWWEGGLYENEYVKEGGIWKIKVLNYRPVYHATFEHGWTYTKPQFVPFFNEDNLYPRDPVGPDEIDNTHVLWPDTDVLPFHYPHPVTGEEWQGVD